MKSTHFLLSSLDLSHVDRLTSSARQRRQARLYLKDRQVLTDWLIGWTGWLKLLEFLPLSGEFAADTTTFPFSGSV